MRMPRKKKGIKPSGNLWSLNGVVKTRTHLNTVILFHKNHNPGKDNGELFSNYSICLKARLHVKEELIF